MRRTLGVILLLALMGGFGFGVNRLIASRKARIQTEAGVAAPTTTRPSLILPGTLYLVQHGDIYSLSGGYFTDLHLPVTSGSWMQPAIVPGTHRIVAVLRADEFSDVYLMNGDGTGVERLSNNATTKVLDVWLNHWMFWPRVGADGSTFYVSYDEPKDSSTYAVDFAIWTGSLTGKLTSHQLSAPYYYTGGDVEPTPLAGGGILFSEYVVGSGNVYSLVSVLTKPLGNPTYITSATDDCGQPALSPDGTHLAMVCVGGTGLQSTRLEVASLNGTTLGTPRVLVNNCLCSAPSWAPDGSGLTYYAPADSSGHFELWWISGAGGTSPHTPQEVTTNLDFDATSPPAWSPLTTALVLPR